MLFGLLNSDDIYQNDEVIQDMVCQFELLPGSDLVFGNVVFVAPDNLEKIIRFYRSGHFRPWKLRFGWMPPHPATFVKKSVYDRVGLYSLDYKISSDYEMFVRFLLVHGLSFSRMDRVLVKMRTGGGKHCRYKESFSFE